MNLILNSLDSTRRKSTGSDEKPEGNVIEAEIRSREEFQVERLGPTVWQAVLDRLAKEEQSVGK